MKPTDEYKICSLEEAEEFAKKRMENPYELADALDWVCENHLIGIGDADFKTTANMLRHQADYIKRLEEGLESSIALNKAQAERAQKK